MGKNPYSLMFGKEPIQFIPRISQSTEIIDTFCDGHPSQQLFMITGIRGIGKTVFMTDVAGKISQSEEWIAVELNPETDLLRQLAAKLSSENKLAQIFKAAKINLSFFGFGLEVGGVAPITDIETALEKMLSSLKKHGKRVLVTVDEATDNKSMRVFASAFQIFIRQDLPLFLLMTGLYENIYELQNEKNLTFLYRAPKIELKALNIGSIADDYREVFQISDEEALEMARMTRGYSFAFQVLGYFTWENRGDMEKVQRIYKQYLDEYVYEKIWSELSKRDQKILYGIAKTPSGRILEIREFLGIDTNAFNPYRKRLIRKGLINGDNRGYVTFTLPLFDRYVLENYIPSEG